jgi:hypothetical protein
MRLAVFISPNSLPNTLWGTVGCRDSLRSMDVEASDSTFTVAPFDGEVESFFREFFFRMRSLEGLDRILEKL